MPNPSEWFTARVVAIRSETPVVKTFVFALPYPVTHLAGQHYEIRLTAPDGYQAARLYSAASMSNNSSTLELTIMLLPSGEISPYMHQVVVVGDQIELRGPLGKFFVWQPTEPEPVWLIAGGSGVVPMRCIMQAHAAAGSATPLRLLYSARSFDEIIYKDDLLPGGPFAEQTTITLSREWPGDWPGETGRIDAQLVRVAMDRFTAPPGCYICGSTPFVEAVAQLVLDAGLPASRIKAERYGAS